MHATIGRLGLAALPSGTGTLRGGAPFSYGPIAGLWLTLAIGLT
jgi:hypothetical protein